MNRIPHPHLRVAPLTLLASAAALATAIAAGTTHAADARKEGFAATTFAAAGSTCAYQFPVANKFSVCTTEDANLVSFKVRDSEHIAFGTQSIEGYALCTGDTAIAYDVGTIGETGFIDVSTAFDGSMVTVVRDTVDSTLRVRQDITRTAASRTVSIKVTVTNKGSAPVTGLRFSRVVDANIANNIYGSFANDFLTTNRSAEAFKAFDTQSGTLKLSNQANAAGVYASIGNSWNEGLTTCAANSYWSAQGSDLNMKLVWYMPSIAVGKSVSTTFLYTGNN